MKNYSVGRKKYHKLVIILILSFVILSLNILRGIQTNCFLQAQSNNCLGHSFRLNLDAIAKGQTSTFFLSTNTLPQAPRPHRGCVVPQNSHAFPNLDPCKSWLISRNRHVRTCILLKWQCSTNYAMQCHVKPTLS